MVRQLIITRIEKGFLRKHDGYSGKEYTCVTQGKGRPRRCSHRKRKDTRVSHSCARDPLPSQMGSLRWIGRPNNITDAGAGMSLNAHPNFMSSLTLSGCSNFRRSTVHRWLPFVFRRPCNWRKESKGRTRSLVSNEHTCCHSWAAASAHGPNVRVRIGQLASPWSVVLHDALIPILIYL